MYEFHVVGDPEKYRLPHAAIIDAWELNDDGFRIDTLDVPVPRLFPHGGYTAEFTNFSISFGTAATLWRSMSSSQRMVAVLLCVILILAIIYFIILPCTYHVVMLQVGKNDE